MNAKEIQKYIDEFEAKAEKAFQNYQETGSPSTMKTQNRYEDLEDICRLALIQVTGDATRQNRQVETARQVCNGLEDRLYAKEEVVNIIWKVL